MYGCNCVFVDFWIHEYNKSNKVNNYMNNINYQNWHDLCCRIATL